MANAHRGIFLAKVKINGVWFTKEADIKVGIVQDFQALLTKSKEWRPSISGMDFEALNRQDAVKLEEPFTEEEVFNTLLALNGDKAPRSDYFSMAFW